MHPRGACWLQAPKSVVWGGVGRNLGVWLIPLGAGLAGS